MPPVCKLMDYGRYKYEQTKREREARKNQKIVELKEVRLRPKIDDHDVAFKTRHIEDFLKHGDKVKVTVIFRGREIAHPEIGRQLLETMATNLKAVANIEKPPAMEGRNMTLILSPGQPKPPPKAQGARDERDGPAPPAPAANNGKEQP